MAASKPKNLAQRQPQDFPLPSSPEKTTKARKRDKGKGRAVGQTGVGGQQEGSGTSNAKASTSSSAEQEEAWPWLSITDAAASRHPPLFTRDGSYFFSIIGSSVKIYSTATGHVVSTLSNGTQKAHHSDLITSATLNPHNAFQLITGSLDGRVKIWDFLDAELLQTLDIEQPIHHIAVHENFKDYLFLSVSRPSKKTSLASGPDDNGVVMRVSTKPTSATASQELQKSAEVTIIGKTRLAHGLAVSPSGSWLVAVGGHKAYVAMTSNLKAGFTKFVSPDALTCLTFHPSEEYFATGDAKGSIRLWYCLNDSIATQATKAEKRAPTTTLHWHSHAVSALAFTPNGAYLLSGGEESVLVIWQLHTGKKEFVPRVGAPISSVVVSRSGEEEYLLGLADASYVFISSSRLKISRSFSRIKLDPAISTARPPLSAPIPLGVHMPSSTLVLPSSHPSSLQTYSPSLSKLLSELEVSPSNRVSRRDEKPLEPARVEQAVVSLSGEWMATIDSRQGDESFRSEIYLKLWQWDETSGIWSLNTRIDRPHGLHRVTSIAFSPQEGEFGTSLLATSGEDGHVKTWRLRSLKDKKSGTSEVSWAIRSVFTFRDETSRHVSWSPDGSLLAVVFGPYVALYDPATGALIHAVTAPEACAEVLSSQFVGDSGRYLATVGKHDVVLWNLVTHSVHWHHHSDLAIDSAISHPQSELLAVFQHIDVPSGSASRPTRISTFTSASSRPRQTWTLPFRLRAAIWFPSSKPVEGAFSLVGITEAWSVVLFGDNASPASQSSALQAKLGSDANARQQPSLFQDIFGKSAFANVSHQPLSASLLSTSQSRENKDISTIFGVPAYLLPSLDTFYDTLVGSFLQSRPVDEVSVSIRPEDDSGGDEDAMELDEVPYPHVAEPDRIIDDQEMDTFIHLFRQVAVKSPHPFQPSVIRTPSQIHNSNGTNGINIPNGRSNSITPSTRPQRNGKADTELRTSYPSPESTPSVTAAPTTPVVAGKKRKKSTSS
ncbi:WD40 repeat-like protein [Amylostereum chailletii]|nr:WD40 repeat-like protein [Amylostereum chailletii]